MSSMLPSDLIAIPGCLCFVSSSEELSSVITVGLGKLGFTSSRMVTFSCLIGAGLYNSSLAKCDLVSSRLSLSSVFPGWITSLGLIETLYLRDKLYDWLRSFIDLARSCPMTKPRDILRELSEEALSSKNF